MSNSKDRRPVAVIGVGNFLLSDEGAGIHAVDLLRQLNPGDSFDIIDGATAGPGLRFFLENRSKVIFMDAGDFGGMPGEYVRFTPDEVNTKKELDGFSLHEFDLLAYLQNLNHEDGFPEEIVLYCIQAKTAAPGNELSPEVRTGLLSMVNDIYLEITP